MTTKSRAVVSHVRVFFIICEFSLIALATIAHLQALSLVSTAPPAAAAAAGAAGAEDAASVSVFVPFQSPFARNRSCRERPFAFFLLSL